MNEENIKIYNCFVKELTEWTETGTMPQSGNQDIALYLELQKNRLQKRKVRMEYRFHRRDGSEKESESLVGWTAKDQKYTTHMVGDDFSREVRFYKENKCLFREKKDTLFYQAITYLNDGNVNGEELYCCPNCSAISSLESLLAGCPYCGTRFCMTDLFPKVTNFYYSNFGINKSTIRGVKLASAGLAALLILIGLLRAQSYADAVQIFLCGLFAVPFSYFFGYLGFSVLAMLFALVCGPVVLSKYVGRDRARKKITSLLKKQDPAFAYDYFLCKMVSILKMVLFSEDANHLAICQGNIDGSAFQDILDITYEGTLTLNSCQVVENYCYLDINLYMSTIRDGGSKIYKKKNVFRMKVCKDITKPEDYGFSIRKIQCHSCGGSFDAAKIKVCPYCGKEYDMKEDDWVVLSLEQSL